MNCIKAKNNSKIKNKTKQQQETQKQKNKNKKTKHKQKSPPTTIKKERKKERNKLSPAMYIIKVLIINVPGVCIATLALQSGQYVCLRQRRQTFPNIRGLDSNKSK